MKLLTMYDCGVIENNLAPQYTIPVQNNQAYLKAGFYVGVAHCKTNQNFSINMQRFTITGKELLKFITPNNDYMIFFLDVMKRKNPNLSFSVHRSIPGPGNFINHDKNPVL